MAKTVIVEQFKKGQVADTSELLLPAYLYSDYWENSDDEEFQSRHSHHEWAACDRCKKGYKLTLTIESK
jgi:hypothetical protein